MKGWKKWMAVGCSHGNSIDPAAREAVLTFRDRWKPDTVLHLGDFVDLSAFRAGAIRDTNESDHAADVAGDLMAGVEFLHELKPNFILLGNHEARLWKYRESPNALLAYAAQLSIQKIEDTAKALKAKITPYGIRNFVSLGDTKFVHGYMFNLAAIRDHAETYGNVVLAHLHRVGWERARNIDGASGHCVGMLADFDMQYASTRRATLAWSQGFAYGYYNAKQCVTYLCQRKKNHEWLLPL
jgi:predicted phosphodiesterase